MNVTRKQFLIGIATAMLMVPALVSAQTIGAGLNSAAGEAGLPKAACAGTTTCIAQIIGQLLYVALGLSGTLLLIMFIWAGVLWMTAGGDPKAVEKARGMIFNAVIGLLIIGLSFVLTGFVLEQLSKVVGGATTPVTGTQQQTVTPPPPGQ
ncbi:MAG: hypothetical protein HY984_00485 [Candidatus Magasanikbacteria bacterium]|nr:hypothetical protein [Candidatus Magasanikbacteria bacterium]